MTVGITSVWSGVSLAAARFDRAAVGVSDSAAAMSDDGAVDGLATLGDALVGMLSARFAFLASLHAARTTNEMVATTLDLDRAR